MWRTKRGFFVRICPPFLFCLSFLVEVLHTVEKRGRKREGERGGKGGRSFLYFYCYRNGRNDGGGKVKCTFDTFKLPFLQFCSFCGFDLFLLIQEWRIQGKKVVIPSLPHSLSPHGFQHTLKPIASCSSAACLLRTTLQTLSFLSRLSSLFLFLSIYWHTCRKGSERE